MQIKQGALAALLLAASVGAHAEWSGKGQAGLVFARGNTDTDTINLKLDMADEVDLWKHALTMAALRAATDGETTADRYMAGWQSNYKFTDKAFWFGGLRYEKDKFSGFDFQASLTTGVGYSFYDTKEIKFSGQVGVGYRQSRTDSDAIPPHHSAGDAIFVAGLNYENQITATTKVLDKLSLESGSDDTLVSNFLGLEVKVSTALALAVGVDARYHTDPPGNADGTTRKKLDTLSTVNLVYSF